MIIAHNYNIRINIDIVHSEMTICVILVNSFHMGYVNVHRFNSVNVHRFIFAFMSPILRDFPGGFRTSMNEVIIS